MHRRAGSLREYVGRIAVALAAGLLAGGGAIVFRWLIAGVRNTGFGVSQMWLGRWAPLDVISVPAVGGILVGLLVYFVAAEAKGSGIPEVILAVARYGGQIRGRVAPTKAVAAALCIGSGGSAGREGPICQIGASLAATLGRALRLSRQRMRMVCACGSGGAIAATFNAPIGGALFALEVILRDFGMRAFGLVVLASVAATALSRATLGNVPAFVVPTHNPIEWWELPLYAMLGVVAAGVGLAFKHILYWISDVFDTIPLPEYCRPALGGLLVGLIGWRLPAIFGVGYETIEPALRTELTLGACLLLAAVKTIATSITLGSGGSGGVFAPLLFVGAVLGSAFGQVVALAVPHPGPNPEGYAIAGMGAVFTSAAAAPVSSVLILFEMTADYRIIVPLMASIVVSAFVADAVGTPDIYLMKLVRQGLNIHPPHPHDPMSHVRVEEVMTKDYDALPAEMTLDRAVGEFQRTGHHGFPVVDDDGMLVGVITLMDLQSVAPSELEHCTVAEVATKDVIVCYPNQTLREALSDPATGEIGRMPVVDEDTPRKLVGLLRRADIIHGYVSGATGQPPGREPLDQ